MLTRLQSLFEPLWRWVRRYHAVLRTMLFNLHDFVAVDQQFVKREHLLSSSDNKQQWFGFKTYASLMNSLLTSKEIDIDVLLMFREEVSIHTSVWYYVDDVGSIFAYIGIIVAGLSLLWNEIFAGVHHRA